jgi:hypothetical protein
MSVTTDWINAAGEVGSAIGTIGAVGVALWLSGRDARRRGREEQFRQAEQITGWLENPQPPVRPGDPYSTSDPHLTLVMRNASAQLAYEVVASLVAIQGAYRRTAVGEPIGGETDYRCFVGYLPPGEHRYKMSYGGHGMHLRFGVELTFRDAAGRCWLRLGEGQLKQIEQGPLEIYGIDPPVPWHSP